MITSFFLKQNSNIRRVDGVVMRSIPEGALLTLWNFFENFDRKRVDFSKNNTLFPLECLEIQMNNLSTFL